MTNLRNELPVAVHIASGGDARLRIGGDVIVFDGSATRSYQISGATRFRAMFNSRSTGGVMLLVGFTNPLTSANASWLVNDLIEFSDDVPDGTTVYFCMVDPDGMTPVVGGDRDVIYMSLYG